MFALKAKGGVSRAAGLAMEGLAFWAAAGMAALLVGVSKGGLPMVGILSVPVLSLVISPVTAAGLLLPVYVVSDMFGLWAYRRDFDKRVLAIMVPATTVGVYAGYLTARVVSEAYVTLLVGLIGLAYCANLVLRRKIEAVPRSAPVAPGVFWGVVTGFVSFVSHSGGPPYQVYTLPLGMRKAVFAGTSTILFAYVNAIKLIPYYMLGQFSSDNLHVAAVLMPVAALAVFAGVRFVRLLPEALFFRLVTWALVAVSVKLVWDGVRGAGLLG